MEKPINVITRDLGIIDGLHTLEVIDADKNEVIGYNQTVVQENV